MGGTLLIALRGRGFQCLWVLPASTEPDSPSLKVPAGCDTQRSGSRQTQRHSANGSDTDTMWLTQLGTKAQLRLPPQWLYRSLSTTRRLKSPGEESQSKSLEKCRLSAFQARVQHARWTNFTGRNPVIYRCSKTLLRCAVKTKAFCCNFSSGWTNIPFVSHTKLLELFSTVFPNPNKDGAWTGGLFSQIHAVTGAVYSEYCCSVALPGSYSPSTASYTTSASSVWKNQEQ